MAAGKAVVGRPPKYKNKEEIEEKINAYLMAIESGQINKSYPLSINKKIVVSVALKYVHNEIGMSFLSKVNEVLLNAGYEFNYHILAEESK